MYKISSKPLTGIKTGYDSDAIKVFSDLDEAEDWLKALRETFVNNGYPCTPIEGNQFASPQCKYKIQHTNEKTYNTIGGRRFKKEKGL